MKKLANKISSPALATSLLTHAIVFFTTHKVLLYCQKLAEHYNFVIIPTRIRKPKDKSLAEVLVKIVQ